jgi:amidophosphoribosyltransferase
VSISERTGLFREECGVFGIWSPAAAMKSSVATKPGATPRLPELTAEESATALAVYYGLYALQHRGEESAGIAVLGEEGIRVEKGMGLVADVFSRERLRSLAGGAAIGHVRYSTAGASNPMNAQPLVGDTRLGKIAIAHNGNLVNARVLRELLEDGGVIFQTTVDSEVILNLIARGAKKGFERAIVDAVSAIKGSFSIVMLTESGCIAVRDPNGIRPLCIGKLGDAWVFSSETCALDACGAEFLRDVEPGEIVIADGSGLRSLSFGERTRHAICAFEYVYFARPDSTLDGLNVYLARVAAGRELFGEAPTVADLVIGVPDSGLAAASGYAEASGIPFGFGFIKNKYVGRSFISPTQELRAETVAVKLNALRVMIEGRRIVMVDDSIVRGTTSKKLIALLRRNGALEVHFRVASPVVKYPCYFGIDTPYRKELIGSQLDLEHIRKEIGADSLAYLSIAGLHRSLGKDTGFCLGCFAGEYPLPAPIEEGEEGGSEKTGGFRRYGSGDYEGGNEVDHG